MLKMLASIETEIYISDVGYLCITQKDWPNEETKIVLSREQTLMLKDFLPELLKEQNEKWDGLDHSADQA